MNKITHMLEKHTLSKRRLARYMHTTHNAISRRQKQKAPLPFVWRVTLDMLDDYLDNTIPRWMSTYVSQYFDPTYKKDHRQYRKYTIGKKDKKT